MAKRPPGVMSAMWGTRLAIWSNSSMVRATPASRAMASRCSTALVEPPSALTTTMAFSSASRVTIWRAVMPLSSRATTASPDRRANSSRRWSTAAGEAEPGSDMPMASAADDMVLAVNIPPQEPSPGQAAFSTRSSSASSMVPRPRAPTASKTFWIVMSWSSSRPGRIDPPYRKTLGTSMRTAAISIPGSDLSQPANVTIPSSRSACITVSTESAMTSRETSEARMPSWPMAMPSDTAMVLNSSG